MSESRHSFSLKISIFRSSTRSFPSLTGLFRSFTYLAAGLAVGLSGLAAGLAVGVVGDVGARATAQQPKIFVGMVLILIVSKRSGTLLSFRKLT